MPSSGREPEWRKLVQESMRELDREAAAPADGTFASRYELQGVIGEGAVGKVYKARDRKLDRVVAVKELHPLKEGVGRHRERFEREAHLSAMLSHPNLIPVYDAGEADGKLRLIMELIEGPSLNDVMAGGKQDRDSLVRLLERAARGVAAAHEKGIVHRDLKPANILVTAGGEPKVGDFGLARFIDRDVALTQDGAILGTPLYMAPEQVGRDSTEVGLASDVYALGAILYEMLTGHPPHQAGSMSEIFMKIAVSDPVRPRSINPTIPVDLETITMKAIERRPESRYAHAGEFADDLRRYLAGESILAKPPTTREMARRWMRRHRGSLSAVSVVIVIATAALIVTDSVRAGRFKKESEATQERQSRALALLEQARPVFDKAVRSLYRPRSGYAEVMKQIDQAHALVEEAVALDPESPTAHMLLGQSWQLRGWEERAEKEWRQALRCNASFSPAHLALGRLYMVRAFLDSLYSTTEEQQARLPFAQRNADAAIAEIEAAIRIEKNFDHKLDRAVADAMLAYIRQDGRTAARIARTALDELGDQEGCEELHWIMGICAPAALKMEYFDRALKIRPNYPIAIFARGSVLADEKKYPEAEKVFTELIAMQPRFSDAYLNRGSTRLSLRDAEGAIADLSMAVELRPDNAVAWVNRALVWHNLNEPAKVVADTTRAIEIEPSLQQSWFFRGLARADLGEWGAALEDYDHYLKLMPDNKDVRYRRGLALLALKRYPEAVDDFKRTLKLRSPFRDLILSLAQALVGAGEKNEARPLLEDVLQRADADWPRRGEAERLLKSIEEF